MILKTGKECKWNEIEIGEVFAHDVSSFCTNFDSLDICIKTSKTKRTLLSDSWSKKDSYCNRPFDSINTDGELISDIYKLPLKTQRLWKEE